MATVNIYILPGCVDCKFIGQAMDGKDISSGLINVAALLAVAAFIRSLGYQCVPKTAT